MGWYAINIGGKTNARKSDACLHGMQTEKLQYDEKQEERSR